MNGYARLSHVKADVAGMSGVTDLDAVYVRQVEEASREIDRLTGRHFYTRTATRYYDGDGRSLLLTGDDLIGVTSLKVAASQAAADAGTFATTLTYGTDWQFWPRNAADMDQPYRGIQLTDSGQQSAFEVGTGNIQIVGKFGYSEEWVNTGLTGTLASSSTTALTTTTSATGEVEQGDMLKLEDEQVEVESVNGTAVTLAARGRNGTTAASHSGVTVYLRRYPRPIEEATKLQVVRLRWSSQGGHQGAVLYGDEQDVNNRFQTALYPRIRDLVRGYRNPAAVL